ncbi:baseplate J/gp47 family protein [Kitasatospora sp. LaBMicrA B282]|uniref:baseplate J/gp47 family protein n=1 Tax=Kitasatospora sp. LaBMicrA B282 TaxID=3420949 RepID=UPI003D0F1A8E
MTDPTPSGLTPTGLTGPTPTGPDPYGVTADGFVLKGIDRIIADQQARARAMFGSDVDLGSGSALRKVLDAAAVHVHELWRALENQYYANFATTAQGAALDLLGTDLGLDRRFLQATGEVTLTVAGADPNRGVVLPQGTVLETATAPTTSLRTTAGVTLVTGAPAITVGVRAAAGGPAGNLAAGQALQLEPHWAAVHLNLGPATVTVANPAPITGGELLEPDDAYRARLLGVPRTLWTQDAVLARLLDVPGVRDAAIFDPLGGVDTSRNAFGSFLFGRQDFTAGRRTGSPYFFDVVVAVEPGWPWQQGDGDLPAVYDGVLEVVRQWRPVSIFPNVKPADQVDVGLRATLVSLPGHDPDAIKGALLTDVQAAVELLNLGRGVLYSDVVLTARSVPGVVDVQNLRLRRGAPGFGEVGFGGAVFGSAEELSVGANLTLAADEIAGFDLDSPLIDLQVVSR